MSNVTDEPMTARIARGAGTGTGNVFDSNFTIDVDGTVHLADTVNLSQLKIAEPPNKQAMLEMLDRLRAQVQNNEIISVVAIPIRIAGRFDVHAAGDVGMLELAGLLGRAWLDATQALSGD